MRWSSCRLRRIETSVMRDALVELPPAAYRDLRDALVE
jgi:hypothetical protein